MILQWLQKLRSRLYSGNSYLQSVTSVQIELSPGETSQWIVGRGQCAFYKIDLSLVEKNKREGALLNRLEILSPFPDTAHWVFWNDDFANVWLWDVDHQLELARQHLQPADAIDVVPVIPESAFCETHEDGVRLCESVDGYVGQCWQDNQLVDEVFWPDQPTEDEWAWFVRGAGQSSQPIPISCEPLLRHNRPWRSSWQSSSDYQVVETSCVATVLILFAALISYQLIGLGTLSYAALGLKDELDRSRVIFEETSSLRESAYMLYETNRTLRALDETRQLVLMKSILEVLPDNSGLLRKWEFGEGKISLVLKNPLSDLEVYATSLVQVAGVQSVQLKPQDRRAELVIEMSTGAQ